MRATAGGEGPDAIRMRDSPDATCQQDHLVPLHRAPRHERSSAAAAAVDAVAIIPLSWLRFQAVAHSTTHAPAVDGKFHVVNESAATAGANETGSNRINDVTKKSREYGGAGLLS